MMMMMMMMMMRKDPLRRHLSRILFCAVLVWLLLPKMNKGFTFFFGGGRAKQGRPFQKHEISPDLRICTVSHVCIRRNVHVRTELRRNQCWNRILLPSFSRGGTDCKCERKTGRRKDYLASLVSESLKSFASLFACTK